MAVYTEFLAVPAGGAAMRGLTASQRTELTAAIQAEKVQRPGSTEELPKGWS